MQTIECRILIVDDDSSVRQMLSALLLSKGYQCQTACDGTEALRRVISDSFDAVITDVVMPQMDGITLTREILKWNPLLPIMVMTGYSESHTADEAVGAGASEFVSKPFNIDEFCLRVQRMMRDNAIIRRIKDREQQINKISSTMIAGIQKDSVKMIDSLSKELNDLKELLLNREIPGENKKKSGLN